MLQIIEGAKNVGKSYLIERAIGSDYLNDIYNIKSYKLPFISYFNRFIQKEAGDTGTASAEAHAFTAGYDSTILSMHRAGLLPENILIDRGIISNLVLGLMQNRFSSRSEALDYLKYFGDRGELQNTHNIYIVRGSTAPDRNKDAWEFMDYQRQKEEFHFFLNEAQKYGMSHSIFENNFDAASVDRFNECCSANW